MVLPEAQVVTLTSLKRHILCSAEDLDLELCLASGQTFSWACHYGHYWMNVLQGQPVILVRDGPSIYFLAPPEDKAKIRAILVTYFRLDHNLRDLYQGWSVADTFFSRTATKYQAIRLMVQDPFESLLSFLCSQNNGIGRITKMVGYLKEKYGSCAASISGPGAESVVVHLHAFPTASHLADLNIGEGDLRAAGFGYRAAYIVQAIEAVASGALNLRTLTAATMGYEQAWTELMKLRGVGPKVADCIALTGLGHMEAFPIDTHMWQLACLHYGKGILDTCGLKKRSALGTALSVKSYPLIGEFFRSTFGPLAGWAHLILFAAKIRSSPSLMAAKGGRSLGRAKRD